MPVCITFDTERDTYISRANNNLGYSGKEFLMLEEAIPKFLEIGSEYNIPYTFFLCGEVAENCRSLFSNLEGHCIGVHTHPFTHRGIFRGTNPNDREKDQLEKYTYEEQYKMISQDLQMIIDSIGVRPKVFRAGKLSTNKDTFTALDNLGINIDCSTHPTFQIIGWQPYKISGTSVWEIPTYCDFSPELHSYLKKLLRISSIAHSITNNIYIGLIHPMLFGNPMLNTRVLFDHYRELIEKMLEWGYIFLTVEQALKHVSSANAITNTIGKVISATIAPFYYLFKRMI